MENYTGTLNDLYSTVMDTFPNQFPYKLLKAVNIEMPGVILMQNGYVIMKAWIIL